MALREPAGSSGARWAHTAGQAGASEADAAVVVIDADGEGRKILKELFGIFFQGEGDEIY